MLSFLLMLFKEWSVRCEVIRFARLMEKKGLTIGTSGNVSVRTIDGYILITPSGKEYRTLKPWDIVRVHMDGVEQGRHKASIEKWIHLLIYATRPGMHAVIHADAECSMKLKKKIPPYAHTVFYIGNGIPVAEYRTPGSEALAKHVQETIGTEYNGCIMSRHGLVACGTTLLQAFQRTEWIERHARVWGEIDPTCLIDPTSLPVDEVSNLEVLFQSYGKGK